MSVLIGVCYISFAHCFYYVRFFYYTCYCLYFLFVCFLLLLLMIVDGDGGGGDCFLALFYFIFKSLFVIIT